MKYTIIYKLMASLFVLALVFSACTKEEDDVRLDPKLATTQVMNISSDSATVIGYVVAQGDGFSERGIAYDVAENPTIDKNKTVYQGDEPGATFTVRLGGLDYATKYYARAYAMGEGGTIYGDQMEFTTRPVVPTLTTVDATNITGNSASTGGSVTVSGGATVTARGVVYGTEENPTIDGLKTSNEDGMGDFVSELTDLLGNTTYYVRAYASNAAGTGYGPQVSFTTLVDLPAVTTLAAVDVTKTSATLAGDITYDGGGAITERGLVWSANPAPTTDDNVITDAAADTGAFTASLDQLELSTTYYVRAYAKNSAGTNYGNEISFTTMADITKFWVVGDYNGWDNSDAAKYIISTETGDGTAEGYVYLKSGGIKLTTDHSWGDAATFGDDGSGGLTNPGGNITVAADGYYFIKANLNDMTYSLTPMVWGVIGDASPNGWDGETPLTYDETSDTWRGVLSMTSGEFKFRANSSWDYNYGSSTADANLNPGGDNIPLDVEADYAFELNLSTPHEYTYAANRWGIIGDATPGGWDNDTDMTWDAANGVFTVTLELLSSGSWKFRANDGWDVNFGGDLTGLTPGGDNITVAEDGNYTITFNPWTATGTIVKN